MAPKARLRAQVEDELRTLYVCPDQLQKQQQRLCSGDQQLPEELHALLVSASKTPGFHQLLCLTTPVIQAADDESASDEEGEQQAVAEEAPLVRLLQRVALWWYYRVMFDPLEQLLALSSSYELLFQLMTPHQQLSCMADILLVLACPFLADHSGQLDTPVHTATLLSMLKMAQQLALAEAQLQEQDDLQTALHARARQPDVDNQERASLQAMHAACRSDAEQAAQRCMSPAAALLRAARVNTLTPEEAAAAAGGREQSVAGLNLLQLLAGLTQAAQQQRGGGFDMVAAPQGCASLHASNAAKAAGALLAQVAELPPQQFRQWWCLQRDPRPPECPSHTVAQWLHTCCAALQPGQHFQPDSRQGDPVLQLLQWVLRAIAQPGQQQRHQQRQQQEDKEDGQQQQQHPAEALRQVLDVLLSALQYRHALSMSEWKLTPDRSSGQHLMLHALHCHCMQLLAGARDQLPAAACAVGSCRRAPTCQRQPGHQHPQQQQQRQHQRQCQAWRLCVGQVQRNLLQVLQLTKDWQQDNALAAYMDTFLEYQTGRAPGLGLPELLNARTRYSPAPAAALQPQAAAGLSQSSALTALLITLHSLGSRPQVAAATARVAAKLAAASRDAAASTTGRGFLGTLGGQQPQLLQQGAATLAAVQVVQEELQLLANLALGSMSSDSWRQQASGDWARLVAMYRCNEQQLRRAAMLLNTSFLLLGEDAGPGGAAGSPAGAAGQPVEAALAALMRRVLDDCLCPRQLADLLLDASAQVSTEQGVHDVVLRLMHAWTANSPAAAVEGAQQQQQGWAGAAAAAGLQYTRELEAMAAGAAGWAEDEVLRLKGGGGGSSSAGTSEAEFYSDGEVQSPPSPASLASPRRQMPRPPPPLQQRQSQQQAVDSGDADDSRDDASTASSDTATEVIVAVAAAGSRAWAHRPGSAGKAQQQEGGFSMPQQLPPQQLQQEHEEPHSGAAAAADSSSDTDEAAHARAVLGFDVLSSAAAAASSSSSSIGRMAPYPWQQSDQGEAREPLQWGPNQQLPPGFESREGGHAAGCAGAFGAAAAAANMAQLQQAPSSSKQAAVRLAAAGQHRQDEASRLDTQLQQQPVCQPAAASSGAKGAFSLRRGFLSPRSTAAAAAAATGPAVPAADADPATDMDTGSSSSGDGSDSRESEFGSPCGSEAAELAALFDRLPAAEPYAAANAAGSSRSARPSGSVLQGPDVWHHQRRLQAAGQVQRRASSSSGATSSSDSNFSSGVEIWRLHLKPGFFEAFAKCYTDWLVLLQGGPQLQQPLQVPPPPQQPSVAEVQAFQPSQHRDYFAAAQEEAVRGWVGLLCTAAEADRAVRRHVARMLEAMELLTSCQELRKVLCDLDMCDASRSVIKMAMQEPEVLALLTLALQCDISDGFLDARDQRHAAEVTERLWVALDSAYSTVILAASKVPAELQRLASLVDQHIIEPLQEEQERSGRKGLSRPTRQQGFAGLVDAVAAWVQLVTQQLEDLGPVPMHNFTYKTVQDEMVIYEESEVPKAVERLELWRTHFVLALDWVKKLVLIDTWLAHAGHALQASHKLLRRTQRALGGDHGDALLAAVQRHFVQGAPQQLSDALVAACAAHTQLQEAFEQCITRDVWGVIQRAFRLMCLLYRAMDHHKQYLTPHHLVGQCLMQRVMGPLTQYLPSVSPYIPSTHLTRKQAALLPNAWNDNMWQQLLNVFARLPHPCASLWWMVMPAADTDTETLVNSRAEGSLLVLRTKDSHGASSAGGSGNSDSSSGGGGTPAAAPPKRPAGRRKKSTAAAQQQLPPQQARPLPADEADGGCDSSGKGQTRGSLEQDRAAVFADARPRDSSSLAPTYDSSDDDAADCHAVLLQQQLQRWQQVFQGEQQQQGGWVEEQDAERQYLQTFKAELLARMQTPTLQPEGVLDSLSWGYMPPGSAASTTCAEWDSAADLQQDRDGSSSSDDELSTRAAQAVHGLRSHPQQQERQRERQLRRLRRRALSYDWGSVRPWHLARAALLARRQLMLSRAIELQRHAGETRTKADEAVRVSGSSSSAGVGVDALLRVLQPAEGPAAAGRAAASTSGIVARLQLQHRAAATAPASGLLVPQATLLLQHVGCTWQAHLEDRDSLLQDLGDVRQGLGDQQQRLDAVVSPEQDLHRLQATTLGFVWEQFQQRAQAGVQCRQLLWQLLNQLNPAFACQWYEQAAAHHLQQQREALLQKTGSSVSLPHAADTAPVPECTSAGLWSTLTRSLASDLLLVPPSIRDMVANNWAAGAGRLPGAGSGSSSSGASGVAARMLVVQYARAARRQYAKGFQTSSLVSQLLVLQLLAEDDDRLAELQPDAQQQLHAALAAHTAAAAAGMLPPSQLAGSLFDTSKGSSPCCCGAADKGVDGGGSSSGTATCSCVAPTLLQLVAQAGCFTGTPQHLLPWLQLVCRYHALSADVTQEAAATWAGRFVKIFSDEEHCDAALAGMEQPWRLMAAACALSSLGLPASPLLIGLAGIAGRGADPRHFNVRPKPLTVSPLTPAAATPVSLKGTAAGPSLLQQQSLQAPQQQQQQQQEEEGGHVQGAAGAIAYWLHAERLTRVPPGTWQQHIAAHVLPRAGGDASSSSSSGSGLDPVHAQLLADVACDWCSKPLPEAPDGSPPAAAYGCPSCGAAQYCSRACAEGAKRVHAANCWRLQALAANGLCWQQAAFQQSASSSRSRSFWDLSAVEPRPH